MHSPVEPPSPSALCSRSPLVALGTVRRTWPLTNRCHTSPGRYDLEVTSGTTSWSVGRLNRHGNACSAQARNESGGRVTVHLYLHSAAQQTSYLGVMHVPFMQGAEGQKGTT